MTHHFTLFAQYAALSLPLAIFLAWRALKALRLAALALLSPDLFGEPLTPCCPNLIVFILFPTFATTMCDFLGCLGVLFGLLKPRTLALLSEGCFFLFGIFFDFSGGTYHS
jgi:hypothetical protein